MNNLFLVVGAGAIAMLFSFWKTTWINKQNEGTNRMKQIGASIADGAMAFLKAEISCIKYICYCSSRIAWVCKRRKTRF